MQQVQQVQLNLNFLVFFSPVCQLEISELEEQKSQVEQQVKQLKETVDKLQTQLQHGGGRSNEQERR